MKRLATFGTLSPIGRDEGVRSCPSLCSSHGVCLRGTCTCAPGWFGDDCGEHRPCSPADCSGHGYCFEGSCRCAAGWEGDDCATTSGCFHDGQVCTGHGSCRGGVSRQEGAGSRGGAAGKGSGEKVWRMPLSEIGGHFDKMIDSKIADMKNIGGRYAGSTTAAQFLQRFVNGVPWAHLDIAGMAWAEKTTATVPEGGTGYGVRLLDRFVKLSLIHISEPTRPY